MVINSEIILMQHITRIYWKKKSNDIKYKTVKDFYLYIHS